MRQYDLDVIVTRGKDVESIHRVHAAVVGPGDELIGGAGDTEMVTYWRSCAKPFQIIPFIQSGGFDELDWGDEQLAIACASHGGEPEHVALVGRMLNDIGLEEGDLSCGPHEPSSQRGARILRESGARPSRLHNNCSGKHAAMLAAAQHGGWPCKGYELAGHPVQKAILNEVSLWTDIPCTKIVQAVDGCGTVVFGMTLERMARAYSRFATAAARGDESPKCVVTAMTSHPFLVGGTDRADSMLIEGTGGKVISKVGAEGVHCAMILDQGIGVAVKVEDGAQRAQVPALLRLLEELDALPNGPPEGMKSCLRKPIKNTRGDAVGEVMMRADAR